MELKQKPNMFVFILTGCSTFISAYSSYFFPKNLVSAHMDRLETLTMAFIALTCTDHTEKRPQCEINIE